jgi:uncharacterized protein
MVAREDIAQLSAHIAREFRPERIILFGSYAYGDPTDASDVDLLVILPFKGSSVRKSAEILSKVSPRFAVDIVVRTPQQIHERLTWNDFFLREIIEKGQVLYESTHA